MTEDQAADSDEIWSGVHPVQLCKMSTTTTAACLHARQMSDARCNYFSLLLVDYSSSSSRPQRLRIRRWSQTRRIRKILQRLGPQHYASRKPVCQLYSSLLYTNAPSGRDPKRPAEQRLEQT
jgi:hypothetical protein